MAQINSKQQTTNNKQHHNQDAPTQVIQNLNSNNKKQNHQNKCNKYNINTHISTPLQQVSNKQLITERGR